MSELVLVFLAIYYWNFYVNKPSDFSEASVVRVTAEQFAWNARYPGDDGKLGAQSKTLVSAANPFGTDKSKPFWEDDVEDLLRLRHVGHQRRHARRPARVLLPVLVCAGCRR